MTQQNKPKSDTTHHEIHQPFVINHFYLLLKPMLKSTRHYQYQQTDFKQSTTNTDFSMDHNVSKFRLIYPISIQSQRPFESKAYYPKHFSALRNALYGIKNQTDFVQSLYNPTQCNGTAGKKGILYKTSNDKCILKFITLNEFTMFLQNFQSYMEYMRDVIYNKIPSLLVPIIGCFELSWTNSNEDNASLRYFLVMPNLFYGTNSHDLKEFDLKGTINTHRYVRDDNDQKRTAKLDKNFIEYSCGVPLILTDESKKYLTAAIVNDTEFLAELNIMDYSLLIGVNEQSNAITCGIIDYLETYSWKKMAEHSFKSLYIDDGTIQEPLVYKQRFQSAILDKYFVSVHSKE